jgi:ferritin-like metal-binding protein YciE
LFRERDTDRLHETIRLHVLPIGPRGTWGAFFQAHPDTPGKLAAFAFAFEHLEIAGYQLLWRVARRAGDQDTIAIAQRIVAQERSMAARLAGSFDRAVQASLSARGVLA